MIDLFNNKENILFSPLIGRFFFLFFELQSLESLAMFFFCAARVIDTRVRGVLETPTVNRATAARLQRNYEGRARNIYHGE